MFGSFGSIIGLIALICAIWVIYDVLVKQRGMKDVHKIIWIVCAIVFSIITAVIYYLVVKQR
jgi:hypothetical protein